MKTITFLLLSFNIHAFSDCNFRYTQQGKTLEYTCNQKTKTLPASDIEKLPKDIFRSLEKWKKKNLEDLNDQKDSFKCGA